MQVRERTRCVTDALSEAAFSARASRCVCVHRQRASNVNEINFSCVLNKQDNKMFKPNVTSFGRKGALSLKNSAMSDLVV